MVAEVEDEGSSARRTFFHACGRGSWILKRKKEFFRGNLRKKREKVLPRVLVEEGSEGSSAGSSERTMSSADLAEEPAEPSSAGNISWSRKNLWNLLLQATYPSRGRTFETSSAEHVLVFFGYFF